ncbi:DNA polymerase III subunit alpha [Mariniluteicoccus flavus]
MSDPFVHLRVASGYSLRYGASQPAALVAAAADADMDTLALTDRDGLYGAVRFAKACAKAGVAPVLGVDLAVLPSPSHRSVHRSENASADRARRAARGGEVRDLRLPRVVVYATSRPGWAALCRLTSEVHLTGERGVPVATEQQVVAAAASGELVVMLGADSELGVHAASGRRDLAEETLLRWRSAVPDLVVGVTDHQVPGSGAGSLDQAGRLLALADAHRVPVVLTNAVRMAEPGLAPTVDVLDASRRLVPLDHRNVDRRNAEAWLKPGKQMLEIADLVARRGGRGPGGAERLLGETRALAIRCRLDPRADLGLGEIHLPELDVLSGEGASAQEVLEKRCEAGIAWRYGAGDDRVRRRLADELDVIAQLGFASYFLTVADVVDTVREMGIRCAARGSGAGSLVNFLLGVSGVDPIRYGLIMERFLSPLRKALPDIDLDVESARRTEIYERVLADFGGERVACVAMLETYRVRHAVRDVGAALSLPPAEVDAIAKAFPHIRARDARAALRDLPELRAAGLAERRLDLLFELVESLDGLPRHVALHPCGVILSDRTLLDRTPVEASFGGFPMSQFDKDDVEDIGLLKLDVLGIRMQSSMAHAVAEIHRTTGESVDLDALADDHFSDADTYDLIASAHTLGCFQIESPGQRELIGKFGPADFTDIIIDISLFRPGPVKSDMIRPFLNARQGYAPPIRIHPDLEPFLAETEGVVVFHEQIIQIIATMTGCSLAQGDEARRALGDLDGRADVKAWFHARTRDRGYAEHVIAKAWDVLESFASFGFCKAHAAAFALPTYQSAWLKTHWPAHFLSGILTHDPGMYPKRLILEEARRCEIAVLGLDVNRSGKAYAVERLDDAPAWGIRLSLADVKGISEAEVDRLVAGQPYRSLSDLWSRAGVSAPVVERLILAGGFDAVHGIGRSEHIQRRGRLTRRDLLLALADLQRDERADRRAASRARGLRRPRTHTAAAQGDPRDRAAAQARTAAPVAAQEVQLPLDLGDRDELVASGLPEMSDGERVRAELSVLGLDVSRHVADFYRPLLEALGVTWSKDLLETRTRSDLLVAGVKVATQTPPIRSGRRVVFLTLDDTTGPVDATFFEDVQGPYAKTLFDSWMLLVRGDLRRTGPRGVSLLAKGCWDLGSLFQVWSRELELTGSADRAIAAVHDVLAVEPEGYASTEPQRVLVHPTGFRQSPYADIKPGGVGALGQGPLPNASGQDAPRKLWHSSPGSSGR